MPSIARLAHDDRRDPAALERLRDAPSALLADAHRDVHALGEPLRHFGGKAAFVGDALTVQAGSLAQWKALDLAHAGQVLVIASGGRRDRAEFGAVFVKLALAKGLSAIVTDGLLRDREEIGLLDIAVMACGSHPSSPVDPQRGRVGFPIEVCGAPIAEGDLIAGDADGLAIIARASVPSVLERLERQQQHEEALAAPTAGTWSLPCRIREALAAVPLVNLGDDGPQP